MSYGDYNRGVLDAAEAILNKITARRVTESNSTEGSIEVVKALTDIITDIEGSSVTLKQMSDDEIPMEKALCKKPYVFKQLESVKGEEIDFGLVQWASGEYLCEEFPDNWLDLDESEQIEFVNSNRHVDTEFFEHDYLIKQMENLARNSRQLIEANNWDI